MYFQVTRGKVRNIAITNCSTCFEGLKAKYSVMKYIYWRWMRLLPHVGVSADNTLSSWGVGGVMVGWMWPPTGVYRELMAARCLDSRNLSCCCNGGKEGGWVLSSGSGGVSPISPSARLNRATHWVKGGRLLSSGSSGRSFSPSAR